MVVVAEYGNCFRVSSTASNIEVVWKMLTIIEVAVWYPSCSSIEVVVVASW